jgi:SRSO17 transposase
MQLPIIEPAPIVMEHTQVFRDLFENRKQFRHFQNYVTGLLVLDNKSMANMSRCILDSADKTNLSRFFSEAEWFQDEVNTRRIAYLLEQTDIPRAPATVSCLILDDTLCEHVGSLFEYIDRHYKNGDSTYPLAHNLVTSHYLSHAVRCPVDARLYRRYEEITQWEHFVQQDFPDREIPRQKKARATLHKEVDATLLQDPEFARLAAQFHTKISLAGELVAQAIARQLPFQTVLMDSWFLAPELLEVLEQHKQDWISLIKTNRNLEVASFTLRDAEGQPVSIPGPSIKVDALVALLPATAYKPVTIGETTYSCFTKTLRIPSLGRVRIVISFAHADLNGSYAVLVTNRTDWTATQMLQRYLQRWPIETFYQDGKGHLGLAAYRMRTAEAIKKHWCLVFVAYSLAHLECLPTRLGAGTGQLPTHPIKTLGDVCRQQGQALVQALILYAHHLLQQGEPVQEVFAQLFAKQAVMATS